MRKDSRARRFCLTWNNYPITAINQLNSFYDQKKPIYMIVGKEIGENGTPHLQGYIHFKNQIQFQVLKTAFPQIHWEQAKGSAEQNRTYCSKEQDFFELGTCPKSDGQASKESWREILSAAESGKWNWLKEEYPKIWVTMSEKLISKRIPNTNVIEGEIANEWWYGETGTGKSKLAWEKYGNICFQKMLNKWWDGYDAHPVVIIEEWSPKNEVTASALKIWADRYPFTAQIKGGVLQKIRPSKIIVISNYRLSDCFPDHRDAEPLQRRFREIRFPDQAFEATCRADSMLADIEKESNDINASDSVEIEQNNEIDDLIAETSSGYDPDTESNRPLTTMWNWSALRPNIDMNDMFIN